MKKIKLFENWLNEAVEMSNITDGKRVVIMPGRFQPFHNGHIAAIKRAEKEFGYPVIPIQIVSKKDDSPFPDILLNKIGAEIAKEFSFIEDFFIYPNTYGRTVIPWFVRFLRDKGYETVGVAAGSDRENAYKAQIKYITSDKTDTQVVPEFEMKIVDERVEGGPSGTKTREAIKDDNEALFKEMTPKSIHKYYKELKKYL